MAGVNADSSHTADDKKWLQSIKEKVQEQSESDDAESWTYFIEKVAIKLRRESHRDGPITKSLVRLLDLGVEQEAHLKKLGDDGDKLEKKLNEDRREDRRHSIPKVICYDIFDCIQPQKSKNHGDQTVTPGSKATPSRAALQKLVEEIEGTEFDVTWCGVDGCSSRQIKDSKVSRNNNILDLLKRNFGGTSFEQISTSDCPKLDNLDFRILRQEGETSFQNGHFQKYFFNVEAAKALDLSKSTAVDGPFLKPATTVDGEGYVVSALTAKPDGTSTVVPMDIEIKSDTSNSDNLASVDYEVLQQAVERVTMRMRNQGYLKMAFAFAVTGRSAWYLMVERPEMLKKAKLWVDRVDHDAVGDLWMHLTKLAEREAGFFFSEDGFGICDAIRKIGVKPCCCRVKALAKSQSGVYGVTVPRQYRQSNGAGFFGVAVQPKDITYAIKIIRDHDTYTTESKALQEIAAKAGSGSDFYALGCVPNGAGDATRFATLNEWAAGTQFETTQEYWWDCLQGTEEGTGGAIIMRNGETTAQKEFYAEHCLPKSVCSDLVKSLQLAHSAGILQCDLRRSNFVRFHGTWQVIDYSLSAVIESKTTYTMEAGAQADCAGYRVKEMCNAGMDFEWTEKDDYQMLIENILGSDQ